MALEQKLSLKLAQKLVMTPSLQQAIKLLQMPRIELEGVLTKELEENPILEESEVGADEEEATDERESEQLEEALADIDVEAFFGEDYVDSWEGTGAPSMREERVGPPIENTLAVQDDLYDHLEWQLQMMDVDPLVREIAELIIGNLEPDGFLAATIEEIQAMGADGFDVDRDPREASSAADPSPQSAAEHSESRPSGTGAVEARIAPAAALDLADRAAAPSSGDLPGRDVQGTSAPGTQATPAGESSAAAQDSHAATEEASAGGASPGEASEEELGEGEEQPIALPEGSYPRAAVEEALALIRSLDPAGVACRDLRESLLCQLERQGQVEDSLVYRVVSDHWDLFTRRKFELIARELGLPLAELKPVVDMIGSLETRPGREYGNDRTQYVEPDVHVVKVGGEYVIQLNDNGLPRLRVSRSYRRMLQSMRREGRQEDAQQYIKEKMRSALWLIKSLDQRQRTIYKVAESIVKQQRGFLDSGVDHLRPMVLRDVAEDIEMHESTVSRVVSNKYIHTPRGLLPMKFFFHSGIDREYGGDISSLTVKRKIKHMIQDENPKKPLSDSELMRVLKREGIQIARRTVAKYRDELGIPSSTERKRIF